MSERASHEQGTPTVPASLDRSEEETRGEREESKREDGERNERESHIR